jgi:hypothetical protein
LLREGLKIIDKFNISPKVFWLFAWEGLLVAIGVHTKARGALRSNCSRSPSSSEEALEVNSDCAMFPPSIPADAGVTAIAARLSARCSSAASIG